MGINLLTFNEETVTPKDDALIQQYALGQDGFFYGGIPTYTGGNTIHFQSGEGMMCGREFVLEDTDVSAALPASGTLLGQVYIHIDLSNADTPIELICETAAELTELTKDENLNVNNGTYDLQLCTFTANVSNITDLVSQIKQIKKGGGGADENLARVEEGTTATAPYAAGEHVVVNGVYHLVTAAIAIGDAFEEGTNIDTKTVGEEITALNQNLTYRWNPTTDCFEYYKNGAWVQEKFAGFNGAYFIKNGVVSSLAGGALPKASFPDVSANYKTPTSSGTSGTNYIISMTSSGSQDSGMVLFSNGIDTSQYSGVHIKWTATMSGGDPSWTNASFFGEYTSNSPSGDSQSIYTNLAYLIGASTTGGGDTTYNFSKSSGTIWLGIGIRAYASATVTVSIKDIELISR